LSVRVIGLTGGIGMGKSTLANLFRQARIPVFDADAAVHRLQAPGGAAVRPIAAAFPGTVENGVLNRARLREVVLADPVTLRRLEAIVHPLVHRAEQRFLARARRAGARMVVLDIPLLFEGKRDKDMDVIVVASAPRAVQVARVRMRRRMSPAQIEAVIARQTPDAEKRRRADLVISTGLSRRHAQSRLKRFIESQRAS
jgi:dephospho-CoA kinase